MSHWHSKYYGFVKSRVAPKAAIVKDQRPFLETSWTKGGPNGAFLKIMKIEHGTQNKLFITVRHRDPLKTILGSGFEKTSNNYETL